MRRKSFARLAIGLVLVGLTIAVFVYYSATHQYLLRQLVHVSPLVVLGLLVFYSAWFVALALTVQASLLLCGKTLPVLEGVLLNAYATLVNFFVPGQGGPAVRGVYMKRRHQLALRSYIFATLLYYVCYAIVSAGLLLVMSVPVWLFAGGTLVVGAVSFAAVRLYMRRGKTDQARLVITPSAVAFLAAATLLQAVVQVALYAVELRAVDSHVTLGQVVTYTGAANFALFVALTPGAIGIRESFLLFSQQLHHISTNTIVAASVIDRGVFLLFLGLLFIVTISLHAKQKLRLGRTTDKI